MLSKFKFSTPVPMFLIMLFLAISAFSSCSGPQQNADKEQEQLDSIERATAAMEAAREAALIKARMEDSLSRLQVLDSLKEE